jgi:pyruvate/2-oxoglutarate/acetoin dehydrogenase E1 component
MNKKIHITESQLKEIFKRINEDTIPLDVTAAAQSGGKTAVQRQVNDTKNALGGNNEIQATMDGDAVNQLEETCKKVTKKEIKEARLQKLVKESVKLVRKKDLK